MCGDVIQNCTIYALRKGVKRGRKKLDELSSLKGSWAGEKIVRFCWKGESVKNVKMLLRKKLRKITISNSAIVVWCCHWEFWRRRQSSKTEKGSKNNNYVYQLAKLIFPLERFFLHFCLLLSFCYNSRYMFFSWPQKDTNSLNFFTFLFFHLDWLRKKLNKVTMNLHYTFHLGISN